MPQINRIRINNVKYNFGTQCYDDFVMRFNCHNTLYDLANGGGKSLLMLLLMQNVIPNCTLDDKQPIEKLFRQGGGNTVIHSLIEWKLDPCYQKDNYKYMTTGFCARKARSQGEDENQPEEAAVQSKANASSAIEYYNYCIFYREFGDNDIKNLPLESNGEKITYNGLKSYLRDLEKKDFGVSVKIFEGKGDYQNFLTQYGIFESQWEIVRGINKTEGHVRTYFENSYKSSRKVVEDLLIEEIIQKSYNNRLGVNNDEGTMAQTLLDIKDKLLELSKKHAQINSYDSQMASISNFADYVRGFKELYIEKERLEEKLYQLLLSCKQVLFAKEKEQKEIEEKLEGLSADREQELKNVQCGQVALEEKSLNELKALIGDASRAVQLIDKEVEEKRHRLMDMESAQDYEDYLEYKKQVMQITETINNKNRGSEDIIIELKSIAARIKLYIDGKLQEISREAEAADKELNQAKNSLDQENNRYTEMLKKQAGSDAQISYIRSELDELEVKSGRAMEDAGLIVAENAVQELEETKDKLDAVVSESEKIRLDISDIDKKLVSCENSYNMLVVNNQLMTQELEGARKLAESAGDTVRLDKLLTIYGAAGKEELKNELYNIYDKMGRELVTITTEKDRLVTFIENAKKGTYECDSADRDKLKKYLTDTYGEDVVEGHEWFRNLNQGQKRDVSKRVPFAEYSFVIKNDFDRIKEDVTLKNFQRGAYVVPIISEAVLYDTKLEVNTELVAFAMKDMNFLRDDAGLQVEIETAGQELFDYEKQINKLSDRRQMIWDDYVYVLERDIVEKYSSPVDKNAIQDKIVENNRGIDRISQQIAGLKEEKGRLSERMDVLNSERLRLEEKRDALTRVRDINAELEAKQSQLVSIKAELEKSYEDVRESQQSKSQAEDRYKKALEEKGRLEKEQERLKESWNDTYSQYYAEGSEAEDGAAQDGADGEYISLESRFLGLKEIIDRENSDLGDKEALLKHYRTSMEKCLKSIEYRGSDVEIIKRSVENGTLKSGGSSAMYELKASIKADLDKSSKQREELDSQNALMNRLEGSVSHGINQIIERFGDYSSVECDNPEVYVKQHKEQAEKIAGDIREVKKEADQLSRQQKDIYVWNKDLERIISNAGMTIPDEREIARLTAGVSGHGTDDEIEVRNGEDAPAVYANITMQDVKGYDAVAKEYDKHMKLMAKKKDEFDKHKNTLADLLAGYGASELATEVRNALTMPADAAQTEDMAERLSETNGLIQLEKDRVSKGIQDMERIKENFENRCIQTCCNIKTDLDRLPKLSTINLDEENISVIGLQIPYVPEDRFKENMSAYIDETIAVAESFPTADERLNYIRNRLTWKRLFSVIVTDMNSIRVNLYKRERIKDQSRYLRYEEAVGSTGQSQGIYIQFLIAVINYISSINAPSQDSSVIGKTIFIDNPFGAAKDIYIWEPIFKMLKTNHVQLIVPARGATPAITGRFDVNYILGQKLTDGRQQTVVVDYYSKTDSDQMEYTRMDYEQASFTFD